MFTSAQGVSCNIVPNVILQEYEQINEYAKLQDLYQNRGTVHDRDFDDCHLSRHKRSKTNDHGSELQNQFSIDHENSLFIASA